MKHNHDIMYNVHVYAMENILLSAKPRGSDKYLNWTLAKSFQIWFSKYLKCMITVKAFLFVRNWWDLFCTWCDKWIRAHWRLGNEIITMDIFKW